MQIKKRCFINLSIILGIMLGLFGCNGDGKGENRYNLPSKTKNDVIIICLDEYDSTVYKNLTSIPFLVFDIISSVPVDDASLQIDGINTPYSLSYDKVSEIEFTYPVFLCYQNTDWQMLYELYAQEENTPIATGTANTEQAYYDSFLYYEEDYSNINQNDLQILYHYEATVAFDIMESSVSENEFIKSITLNINGKKFEKNIGNITLDYKTENHYGNYGLIPKTVCTWNKKIIPNREGIVTVDDFSFTCSEDMKITGFYLLNENANISSVTIKSEKDGTALDQIWDNSPMDFVKGTVLTPLISVSEKALEGNATYFTIIYVVMEYEINGQEYEAYYHSMFRTRPNAYEVYASEVDAVDILTYYFDFYNKIRLIP